MKRRKNEARAKVARNKQKHGNPQCSKADAVSFRFLIRDSGRGKNEARVNVARYKQNMEIPNVPKLMRFHSFYEARSPEWSKNSGTLAWQF